MLKPTITENGTKKATKFLS